MTLGIAKQQDCSALTSPAPISMRTLAISLSFIGCGAVTLAPHAVFRADKHDLYFDLALAPWEAALGAG